MEKLISIRIFIIVFALALLIILPAEATYGPGVQNDQMKSLVRKINDLEKELNSNNAKLITIIKKKNSLNQELVTAIDTVEQTEDMIDLKIVEINNMLKKLILGKQNTGHNVGSLVANDLMIRKINEQKNELNQQLKTNTITKETYLDLQKQIQEYSKMENEISEFVNSLEDSKKNLANEYLVLESKGYRARKEAALKKATKILKTDVIDQSIGPFKTPIENFIEIERKDNKGVNLTFAEVQVVKSPREGKILYAGDISPYGNVIMISHPNNIQSVILGEFTPKVSKGDIVQVDDVLGYTKVLSGNKAKIYFELRKNNKAINTTHYIDTNSTKI